MGITYFFYKGGMFVADGAEATSAAFERFGASIASGEAMGIAIGRTNEAAPLASAYFDASFLVNFEQAAIAQNWNPTTKEVFGSTLGMLAGAVAVGASAPAIVGISGLVVATAAAVLVDQAFSWAFSKAYDGAQEYFANPNLYYNNQIVKPVGNWLPLPGDPNWHPRILGMLEDPDRQYFNNGRQCLPSALNNSWLTQFQVAEATPPSFGSPIILDLDGDGVETTAVGSGAFFDHSADGFAESTGWVGADDGLLVIDRDGNGRIDSGRELFGNETLLANGQKAANGFAALAELDSNADGRIDAQDAAWSSLKVWRDLDGDGYAAAGELIALPAAGVVSIALGYSEASQIDAAGNEHRQVGSFTRTDGTTGTATDVWFQRNLLQTIPLEWVDVSPDIQLLPNAMGTGTAFDLQQAMARDASGTLQALVTQFVGETDVLRRGRHVQEILFAWAGADNRIASPLHNAGNVTLSGLTGNDKSRRRRDGEWNGFGIAANNAVFGMRRMG